MIMHATYKECGSDWSHQVYAVETTLWLQCDHTLPLCKVCGLRDIHVFLFIISEKVEVDLLSTMCMASWLNPNVL